MADAKNTKFEIRKETSSENNTIVAGGQKFTIDDTRIGKPAIGLGSQEIDTDRVLPQDFDYEKFMAEILEVHVADAPSEDDPQFAEIGVNGDRVIALRGATTRMRRYHVAVLAQAKTLRVSQKKVVHADGSMSYEETAVPRLSFPFSVVDDPSHQRGRDWLKQQMRNPV